MSQLVFVYGSLKKGFYNHGILENSDAEFIGNFKTPPKYTMYKPCLSWPGVTKEGSTQISGEVYKVFSLEELDFLEGFDEKFPERSLFYRELIDTEYGKAWTYFFNKPSHKIYKTINGDW